MKRYGNAALITLSIAVLASACSGTEAESRGLEAHRDTVDGVPRLLYPGTGGQTLAWRMDTLAVIGDILGDDPDYQFDQVTPGGVTSDAAGNVWLLDGTGHRVLGYSPDGAFIASHGRKGSGPGEINMPFGVIAGPGDTLWVTEMMSGRLTGYPAGGGEPRVITFDASAAPAPPLVVREDRILAAMRFTFGPGQGPRPQDEGQRLAVVARYTPDGTLQDTLYAMPLPEPDVVQVESGNRRMMMLSTPRFSPILRWAVFSDGSLAVVDDDRYSIHILNPDGTERLRIERDAPPRATTEADKQAVLEEMRSQEVRTFGTDRAMVAEIQRRQIESTTFAATIPRIESIAIDPQDRLWVLASSDEPGADGRVDLYDRDGALLGTLPNLKLPAAFLRNGLAAYLGKDEDTDVQQVTVVRLIEG